MDLGKGKIDRIFALIYSSQSDMSEQVSTISWGKIGSDVIFGVAMMGCFLRLRKSVLTNAYLTQRMSPFAAGILKFERKRNASSQLYYIQRTVLYLVLAAAASAASQKYNANQLGVVAKGCLFGSCFGSTGIGIIVGTVGGACWWGLSAQIKDYL